MPSSDKVPFTEKLFSFLKREAKDVKEGLGELGKTLDTELAEREKKLKASPTERIDMLQGEMAATDSRFDEIAKEVNATGATASAAATVSSSGSLEDRLEAASVDRPVTEPESAPTDDVTDTAEASSTEASAPAAAPTEDPAIVEAEVADKTTAAAEPEAAKPAEPAEPDHHLKTDLLAEHAVMKEQAADKLDELRGELGLDG